MEEASVILNTILVVRSARERPGSALLAACISSAGLARTAQWFNAVRRHAWV